MAVTTALTTTNQFPKKLLRLPLSDLTLVAVLSKIYRTHDEQQIAATATTRHVARHSGKVQRVLLEFGTIAGAGESMTFDIQKNGVTILTATQQFTSASGGTGIYDITPQLAAATFINVGDVLSIVRTYVAGTPTMTLTGVNIEWA